MDHARERRGTDSAMILVSRHRSSVGLRWPSKRIAALHRLPIQLGMGKPCALRRAPKGSRRLRHLIRDATLGVPFRIGTPPIIEGFAFALDLDTPICLFTPTDAAPAAMP